MRGVLSRPEVGGQSACSDRKLKQTFAASVPNDEVGWKRRWGACSPSVGSAPILFIRPPQFMSRKRMNANAPLPAAIDGLLSPAPDPALFEAPITASCRYRRRGAGNISSCLYPGRTPAWSRMRRFSCARPPTQNRWATFRYGRTFSGRLPGPILWPCEKRVQTKRRPLPEGLGHRLCGVLPDTRSSRARAVRTARQYSIGVIPVAFANRRRKVRLSNPAAAAMEAREASRPSLMCTHS